MRARLVVEDAIFQWELYHPGERMTYTRLAQEANIPLSTLNRMRRQVKRINLKKLDALAQVLDYEPADMLEFKD
ncbi:MAG: hypothetical protein US96_C0007G0025 [Candidatus Woesebacteria bacterium GW2011_GWB1_38_5b]|uniref:HTH cro/C1-type domain-containing protein n=1 Tax=Candidatus Woesebacteria bacterium GW2011_GWB1_38_5b TaxID=1618569 RepID=A0A0G0KA34_9BACT|nr:MAG: hypothetical protein US96_C0007G0025 [Candidatus Woesebacteria bacterium GW2011_GWB1_38_5b]